MKRKLNINRPEISSEEIAQRKNFDSVLKNHANISGKPLFKKPWFLSSVIVATVAIVTTVILLNQHPASDNQQLSSNNQQLATSNQQQAINSELEFYKKEDAKPCISPPLKDVNVPYTTYKVIAEKGANLNFKTGSKLVVPKNSFVDENGKLVKGEIELRYREFHDPIDFFVSGIPMTYDSAGVTYQFESAGMMEMLAYQDGKPVNMAPEKAINVELASNYKGTEYNLYKLDTVKNNWACLGKDKVVTTNEAKGKAKPDTAKIVKVEQTPEYKTLETKKVEIQKEKELKIAALPKVSPEPKKPELAKAGKFTFDLTAQGYPELEVYKGLLFEIGEENKYFDKALYKITWDEATIKDGTKKGENYLLTLRKETKKYEFIVYPVYEGKNYETAMKEYQEKFSKYNVVLEKRKVDEKRIEEEYQAKLLAIKKAQEAQFEEWKRVVANQEKSMSTEEQVRRMFSISSFGVYNSDSPSHYPKGIKCSANLSTDKNVKLLCYEIYLADKKKNGLFTFNRNPIASFSFDPNSKNLLWTVENGVLYWLKPEQFIDIKSSDGMQKLVMNRVDQKFKSVDELKTYFNF